jgi:hypothetical protein
MVNLSGHETGHAPAYEYYAAGPVGVSVAVDSDVTRARELVSGNTHDLTVDGGKVQVTVKSIVDHEVIVFDHGDR